MAKHAHAWKFGYVPGEGFAYCACGKVERRSPSGKRSKAPASLVRLVRKKFAL